MAFSGVRRDFIGGGGKTPCRGIFARLVTNNIFVIIVTLIITFSIWIVKCCHQALYRYSFFRISPYTTAVLPLFSQKHIPQYRFQDLPACQHLPGCESFNKLLLPAKHTHQPDTQHGQEKIPNSIRIIIIIVFIIRWFIYLFVYFWTLNGKEKTGHKERTLQ